ncbi:MAG: ABC transporter ATP-binding protein, partial [Microbacteriaceae bacterium]|nr:ABC transporter ATP-binding protein [Microbacteriaceae bacterium]
QQQQIVSELIKREAKDHNTAVLFVTHDVNPVLDMVDRVLYLANGSFSIGTPDEVFRSDVLSSLYGTKVEVIRNNNRIVVVGAGNHDHHEEDH